MTDTDFTTLLHNSVQCAKARVANATSNIVRLNRELENARADLSYMENDLKKITAFSDFYNQPDNAVATHLTGPPRHIQDINGGKLDHDKIAAYETKHGDM